MKNNATTQIKSVGYELKGLLVLFALMVFTLAASAQKSAVLAAFSKYGIDQSLLIPGNLKAPDNYAFDLKETTITNGKSKVTVAKFDPSGAVEEQWTVVSIDGKSPSNGDIKTFRKNKTKPEKSDKTDDESYKIEKETADQLVISYKMDAASLSKDAESLKDCRLYMTIDLRTKKLSQIKLLNEKPIKIKILKADKFEMLSKYTFNDQAKHYLPLTEDLNIEAKFMGQPVTVQTITEYSNYTKK